MGRQEYEKQIQNMIDDALMDNCMATTPRAMRTSAMREILLNIY